MTRAVIPRAGDRWRSLRVTASLLALVALVLGVPLALIAIGGAPFVGRGSIPLGHLLAGSHAGDPKEATQWIANAALVLAWSVWAWLALCVVVEFRSWITGGSPARIPGSRTVQSMVAILVGTTLAVTAGGRGLQVPHHRGSTAAVPGMPSSPAGHAVVPRAQGKEMVTIAELAAATGGAPGSCPRRAPEQSGTADPVAVLGERPADPAPERTPTYRPALRGRRPPGASARSGSTPVPRTHLVHARETLWSIAEAELGTALRWQELAQLNYDVTQEDGRALDEGHWVTPGWRLLLPPVPSGTQPVTPPAPPRPSHRGPTPGQAEPQGGPTVAQWPDVPPGGSLDPGTPEAPLDSPVSAPGSPRLMVTEPGHGSFPVLKDPIPLPAAPVVPLGAGVVGSGIVRLIDRMRQVQQRHRPEGGYIRLPHGPRSSIEWRLRVGDGLALTQQVDRAVRLAVASRPSSQRAIQILGLRVHAEVIELVPASADDTVVLDRHTVVQSNSPPGHDPGPSSAVDPPVVAPMLVAVGRGLSGTVLVNLEALGSLVVHGNSAEADAVVLALTLSWRPRSGRASSRWRSSGSARSWSAFGASSCSRTSLNWSITSAAGDSGALNSCRLVASRRSPRLGWSTARSAGLPWW